MLVTLRRFLSLCALLFWQGGFLFYGLVVIPIAVGPPLVPIGLQSQVTARATNVLNGTGVVVLALLLWDLASSADPSRRRHRLRGICWAVLFLSLAALFGLHTWLDLLHPTEGVGATDVRQFNVAHTLYLIASGLQWLAGLAYLGFAVSAWRAEDEKEVRNRDGGEEKKG